jgi:acetylornithine deacetylase/succinyl-diaminopimelate desuccinylase-like protein
MNTRSLLCGLMLGVPVLALAATPVPGALDILQKSVSFETSVGKQQVPAYAAWLRDTLQAAGFAAADMQIEAQHEGAAATATFTARYPGRNPASKPLLLIGHMDVVTAQRADWVRDPFTATIDGGYLYGRGVKDNKFDISMMVAVLVKLKRAGFVPERDIILALTGDEETTGDGAARLAERFRNAELVLNGDSGGGKLDNQSGAPVSYAIQGGEKTYVDFTLTVTDPGGHSARPTATNAIYRLSNALTRLEAHRFPVQSNELTQGYFRATAPVTPGPVGEAMRRYVANPGDTAAVDALSREPELVGLLRTTCVATQLAGGHAPNALPQRATANVNCRVFPGTSVTSVQKTLQSVLADPGVAITYDAAATQEAPASPLRSDVMAAVSKAVHARYPGLPIAPTMSPGATDGRDYRARGVPVYGVSGLFIRPADDFAHGLNERVPLDAIDPAVAFWESLVRDLSR